MSSSPRTYTKRNGHYSQIDDICFKLQAELEPYLDDKDYKKIKKQKLALLAKQTKILPRRLKYIYKSFENRGTTKKFSGQSSCYSDYDEKIFQKLKFWDFNQKDFKKAVKSLAIQIIKPEKKNFQGSDAYIRRLLTRFQISGFDEQIFQELKSLDFTQKDFKKAVKNLVIQIITPQIPSFKCSDTYIKLLLARFEKWRQAADFMKEDDFDFDEFECLGSNAKPHEEGIEGDLCNAETQDQTIITQTQETTSIPKEEKEKDDFLMHEVGTLSKDAPTENQGLFLEEFPTFPAGDYMGYFSPSRFINEEEVQNIYRFCGDYCHDGYN